MAAKSSGATLWRAIRTLTLVAFGFLLGACKTTPVNPFRAPKTSNAPAEDAESKVPDAPDATASDEPSKDNPGETQPAALDSKALESDAWYEQVRPPFDKSNDTWRRWRHARLDARLTATPARQADLSAELASENPVVAANAAILLAHWNAGQPAARLIETIRSTSLNLNLRCAAAEALGKVATPDPAAELRGVLEEIAPTLSSDAALQAAPPSPLLHAELVRALGRHGAKTDAALFTAALRGNAWNVRLAGLEAWEQLEDVPLPAAAIDLRSDQDPRLRAAALRTIASHRDPNALEYFEQALSDRTLEVQSTAIAALGDINTAEARALLEKLKGHRSELTRAASLVALAASGLRDEVESAAKDTSQQVRLAVAQTLAGAAQEGKQVAAQTVATAKDLTRDASSEVQRQAVASLAAWPIEQAGPVLLLAMAEGGYAARKTAAAQLAERWPPAADFPVDAVVERRATVIAELKQQWAKQYGQINEAVVAAKTEARELIALSQDRVREISGMLDQLKNQDLPAAARREIVAQLKSAGPELKLYIDQQLDPRAVLPPEVYDEVLPAVAPAFAVLPRLMAKDVLERRAAATELANQAVTAALPPFAVTRIEELMEAEKDPVVWRSILAALTKDTSDASTRVAYVGIGNASVEVRVKSCEFLATRGDPRHLQVLLPVLADPDATVVLAAARAMGSMQRLDDPAPLVRLLNLPDKQVRLAAATSLTRLKVEHGAAALERLALDPSLEVRLQAAKTMGELNDPMFLPPLMAMLADKPDAQRVAMASLAQIAGMDPAAQDGDTPLSNDEKVRRWQSWYRERQEAAR